MTRGSTVKRNDPHIFPRPNQMDYLCPIWTYALCSAQSGKIFVFVKIIYNHQWVILYINIVLTIFL